MQEVQAKREQIDQLHQQQAAVDKQANEFRLHQAQLTDLIRELERVLQTAAKNKSDLHKQPTRQVFRHATLKPNDQAPLVHRPWSTDYTAVSLQRDKQCRVIRSDASAADADSSHHAPAAADSLTSAKAGSRHERRTAPCILSL